MLKNFSKVDLAAMAGALVVLVLLLAANTVGERARTARCGRNLAVLGQGMQAFAADHNGGLPPAYAGPGDLAWSYFIAPYVRPELGLSNSPSAKWEYEEGIADRLLCPSDRLLRGFPRSYSMPAHGMRLENWPPSGRENCGVGLVWDGGALKRLLKKEVPPGGKIDITELSLIKAGQLPDPAHTLLLTELVRVDNKFKSGNLATVNDPNEQVEAAAKQGGNFHRGGFNYLMVDGHVEWLRPYSLEAFSSSAGIWSMRKGD
jgi:prepilin-type processing-associated H-X9-DG protein